MKESNVEASEPQPSWRHILKTWPEPFKALWSEAKTYEIRHNDRGYAIGDYLVLREYDQSNGAYSGRAMLVRVTYMTSGGEWGVPSDFCVMAISERQRTAFYAAGCFDGIR